MTISHKHLKIGLLVVFTSLANVSNGQETSDAEDIQRCEEAKAAQPELPQMVDISCEEMVRLSKPQRPKIVKIEEQSSQ